jgi:tetratricopeptide (TPR) repeat protein
MEGKNRARVKSAFMAWLIPAFVCLVVVGVLWGCARQARQPGERVYLHKVDSGETLSGIAEDYYGDPERADVIAQFNGVEGDTVAPGTVLRVPMRAADIQRLDTREKARVSYNKGLELVEKASYLDAVEQFQDALSIDPTFVDAIYNLGVTLQTMKSYEKAKGYLERAAELRPGNADYRFALGNCLFHLEDFSGAARAFERVMEMDPANTKALYSLAVCYEKVGEKEKAVRTWERYLELDSTSAWAAEARKRLEALK